MRILPTVIVLSSLTCAVAAEPASPGKPAQPYSATIPSLRLDSQKHVIHAGDQVEVHILTLPELEKVYTVRADGRFFHPIAGEVQAAGLNVGQLEARLKKQLSRELRSPLFRVGLHSVAQGEVAVLGEVNKQGKYKVFPGTTLLDLLADAGGVNAKADPEGAVILRQGTKIPISLAPSSQEQLAAFELKNGDIFYVHPGRRISVVGEVKEAGTFAISSKSANQVEDAVKSAGGAKDTAALSRVQIIRPSLKEPLVVDLLNRTPEQKLPELEDGDTIVVQPRQVVLLGAFAKPGALPLSGKESLVDVLSRGGLTQQGRLDSVVVIRAEDVRTGTDKKEQYDLMKFFQEGQAVTPVPIRDGDLVFVPNKDDNGGMMGGGGLMNLLIMARSLFAF